MPLDQLLEESPVDCREIGHDAGQPHQGADDDQDHSQDQRLHVSRRRDPGKIEIEEPQEQGTSRNDRDRTQQEEDAEWVVENHDAGHAGKGPQDIAKIGLKETRRTTLTGIHPHRHRNDIEAGLSGLENRFQGVGEGISRRSFSKVCSASPGD